MMMLRQNAWVALILPLGGALTLGGCGDGGQASSGDGGQGGVSWSSSSQGGDGAGGTAGQGGQPGGFGGTPNGGGGAVGGAAAGGAGGLGGASVSAGGSGGVGGNNIGGSGGFGGNGGSNIGGSGGFGGNGGSIGGSGGFGGNGGSIGGSGGFGGNNIGGSGGFGGAGGSPPLGSQLLALASGPMGSFGAAFDGTTWTTTSFTEASTDAPSLAVTSNNVGVGALRAAAQPHALRYLTWGNGSWSAFADVGAAITTRATPSLSSLSTTASLLFHGDNFMHYYAEYSSLWSPAAEPVQPAAQAQSFGPEPGAVSQLGNDAVIAFAGGDGNLYTQVRAGGNWQAAQQLPNGKVLLTPALCALATGPELLALWVHHDPGQLDHTKLFWSTRTAGVWSTAAKISDSVFSNEAPSLTVVPAIAGALATYRGADGKPYAVFFSPTSNPPWSPAQPLANPNPDVLSPPALTQGIGTASAEVLYVATAGGTLHHIRLTATGFAPATLLGGGGLVFAAAASKP